MVYRITAERDYLRADLFNRETAEEAREYGMVDVVLDHRSQLPSANGAVRTRA